METVEKTQETLKKEDMMNTSGTKINLSRRKGRKSNQICNINGDGAHRWTPIMEQQQIKKKY